MIGTVNGETERLLAQGQDAARKGDKPAARTLLTQVVERDPHNELAWMWLSGVVEEPEEQQICLENVLVINPQNDKARRGLDFVSTKTGIPPHLPPDPNSADISASELTSPLTADSPMYGELSGHASTWGNGPDFSMTPDGQAAPAEEDSSLAFLAWMQSSGAGQAADDSMQHSSAPYMPQFEHNDGAGMTPSAPWQEGPQPLHQEQLDWNQPGPQFNVMSMAQGVDDRLAQFEPAGKPLPPWANSTPLGDSMMDGSNMQFGVEPFALGSDPMGMDNAGPGMASFGSSSDGMGMMGPMGLHSDSNLPSPQELPTFEEPAEQPWYLQSSASSSPKLDTYGSSNHSSSSTSDGARNTGPKKKVTGALVECPHCHATVADTSITCPQCRYSFFVNCPYCHELVDAVDAGEGKTEPCPYCEKPINRLELGLAGTDSAISYKSVKASPDSMAKRAMEELEASRQVKQPMSFRWLVDVAWLVVIIAAVWALSQLPTWLHLVGQY